MVIQSQQEGLGNNETYFLDNLQSPLFTALMAESHNQYNYENMQVQDTFLFVEGLMALQSHHKSFQSKVFFFLSFPFQCVSSSESDLLRF